MTPTTGCYVKANLLNFDNRHNTEWTPEEAYSNPLKRVRGVLVA
jgi:hypothetical protein